MKRGQKWTCGLGIATIMFGAAWLVLVWWIPNDEELAVRLTAEAEKRLGVKVSIGSVHWTLLPKPVVVIHDFRTQQVQPVVIGQLSTHPNLRALLNCKLAFERIDIVDAVFPQNSVHVLYDKAGQGGLDAGDSVPLEHFEFRNLTWIFYDGIPVVYEGEIDFERHWRPRHAALRRPGIRPAFNLTLTREANADRWQTRIHVGGGRAHGHIVLTSDADGAMHLSGQLAPQDIEVASASSSFNRRSPVMGRGSGSTELSAKGKSVGALARSLHTTTRFSVSPATILHFDLDKSISTLGNEHDGETALQELTGQLDTQNTDEGIRMTFTDLKARAGKYTATGKATIYHRQIEASGNLDLIAGGVGIPFALSGPLHKPKVSVPSGFFAGAAIGTVVLPGVGTLIGARIGGALDFVKGDVQPRMGPKKKKSIGQN